MPLRSKSIRSGTTRMRRATRRRDPLRAPPNGSMPLIWTNHKRQAKRLHRTAARRRKEALHRFSTEIVNEYHRIVIGDVSSLILAKTRMAKSVLDAGWG